MMTDAVSTSIRSAFAFDFHFQSAFSFSLHISIFEFDLRCCCVPSLMLSVLEAGYRSTDILFLIIHTYPAK